MTTKPTTCKFFKMKSKHLKKKNTRYNSKKKSIYMCVCVHFKKNSMQSKNNELFNNNATHIKTQQK